MDANHLDFPVENKPLIMDNIRSKTTVLLRLQPAHSVELLSKSLHKNSGSCLKKCAMSEDEVSKSIDDVDRKMHFSRDMVLGSESQGFSERSGVRLNEGHKSSCTSKRIRCPLVRRMPNNSITKVVNPSFKKYPKHLRMGGTQCLKEHLTKFVEWPGIVRKKRSSSDVSQLSNLHENAPCNRSYHINSQSTTTDKRRRTIILDKGPSTYSPDPTSTIDGSDYLGKHHKKARYEFGTLSAHSLPDEVVDEILSRLPVKSLVRFRCVCKSWNHLLSYSERFISLHLQNYRVCQLLVGTCSLNAVKCYMYFLPPPPRNGGYSDNDAALQKMMKHEFPKMLDGSCNGIVCLYGEGANGDIVFWNPATKESKIIPKSLLPHKQSGTGWSCLCAVGFGFDPKTNDYKILRMVGGGVAESCDAQLELYSLRKDSWKKVESHDFYVMRSSDPADVACRLPFTGNRIVCAVVSPLRGPSKWELLLFDMSSETYEIIPMSASLDEELGGDLRHRYRKRYFKVFPYKETVALGIARRVGKSSYCDIWVLNSLSCTTPSRRCWIKLLSTNMNDCWILPVGCWESEFLFQEKMSGRLLRYDHGKNMMVELGVVERPCVTTSVYKESLVCINNIFHG